MHKNWPLVKNLQFLSNCHETLGNHFHQVSWGLDKTCGFFTNGQVLSVSGFFTQTLEDHVSHFFAEG